MKKNIIFTIIFTFSMIVAGTSFLYGSMVNAQDKTISKKIQPDHTNLVFAEEKQQASVTSELTENSLKDDKEYLVETEDGFTIEFDQEHSALSKEAADMEMEDAFSIALKQIEKTYSVSFAGNKVIMTMDQKSNDANFDLQKGARYYTGFIICDSESGYSFKINSITGELCAIGKYYKDIDNDSSIGSGKTLKQMGVIYDMYTEADLKNVQDTYYKIAKEYIEKYLDEGKVVKAYGICPGTFGTNYVDVPNMYVMLLYCEMDNGDIINIQVDQITKEVVYFAISN